MPTQLYPWGLTSDLLQVAHQKNIRYVLAKLSLLIFIWAMSGFLIVMTDSVFIKIILWFVLGYFINGIIQLVHESWHNNLFNQRWANRLTGHILSFLFFVLYAPSRHGHMLHHRYNRTDKDPDAYNAGSKSWHLTLLYYGVLFFGVPLAIIHFNILYPLQFYKRNQLAGHFLQLTILVAAQAVLWTVIIKSSLFSIAWQVWLMPVLFASPWNGLKSVADHFQNKWQGNPFNTATTVTSNGLTTYFWNGLNYHLEHHLFPAVPGYHLATLHPHLNELYKQNNSPVFSSYMKVWINAISRGPELVTREGEFNPFHFNTEK